MFGPALRRRPAAVKGYVATPLRTELSLGGATVERFQQGINEASDRLGLIISNLLSTSRIESGLMRPNFQVIDLRPLVDRVVGIIWDSPMLDFEATVDLAADRRNLPGFLTAVAKRITGYRFDVDWGELDYLKRTGDIPAPVLLFHGAADEKVPVSVSTTLAERLPDLVTYVLFPELPTLDRGTWTRSVTRRQSASSLNGWRAKHVPAGGASDGF